jgi:hypothetical protein
MTLYRSCRKVKASRSPMKSLSAGQRYRLTRMVSKQAPVCWHYRAFIGEQVVVRIAMGRRKCGRVLLQSSDGVCARGWDTRPGPAARQCLLTPGRARGQENKWKSKGLRRVQDRAAVGVRAAQGRKEGGAVRFVGSGGHKV